MSFAKSFPECTTVVEFRLGWWSISCSIVQLVEGTLVEFIDVVEHEVVLVNVADGDCSKVVEVELRLENGERKSV